MRVSFASLVHRITEQWKINIAGLQALTMTIDKVVRERLWDPVICERDLDFLKVPARAGHTSPDKPRNDLIVLDEPARTSAMCEEVFQARHSICNGPKNV